MENQRDKVKRLLKILYNVDAKYVKAVRKMGYKSNLFWLLYYLDNNEPMSQKQICEDWDIPKTTINTLIKECEQMGYITFEPIKGQRREKVIILTDKGKEYAKQMLNRVYKVEEEAFHNVKDGDKLIELSQNFLDNLKSSFEKELGSS